MGREEDRQRLIAAWSAAEHVPPSVALAPATLTIRSVVDRLDDRDMSEEIKLIDLMKMLMAVSGNDAAYAIGDLLTGSAWAWPSLPCTKSADEVPAFIDSMNTRATSIGMNQTTFTNAAGLDWPLDGAVPRSTAFDLSRLARQAMADSIGAFPVGLVHD